MKRWLGGKNGGLVALVVLAVLVAGALAGVTRTALRLEEDQLAQQARAEHDERVRLALWQLDSRMSAFLAREDSRPFNHYSAISAPTVAFDGQGVAWPPGSVIEPSPLLHADLPAWMLLHFQVDAHGWESPQVLSRRLRAWLTRPGMRVPVDNATQARQQLLARLSRELPAPRMLQGARLRAGQATTRDRVLLAGLQQQQLDYQGNGNVADNKNNQALWQQAYGARSGEGSKLANTSRKLEERVAKDVAVLNARSNGEEWLSNPVAQNARADTPNGAQTYNAWPFQPHNRVLVPPGLPLSAEVLVSMSPMVGVWLPAASSGRPPARDWLVMLRLVHVEEKELCQGIVLDGDELLKLLAAEVSPLLPGARVHPVRDEPTAEQLPLTMTTLPVRLDPGPVPAAGEPGWTPLRVGLALAWAAAGVAVLAVGLGGWSLFDLSERRMRFVSAVTHELRTPLTTLRLYLDMLLGGLVREEAQKTDYLRTLDAETDRLARLVGNVLDFSRLETQRPRLSLSRVKVADLLAGLSATWQTRCLVAGKQLLVEDASGATAELHTDVGLLGQVLANLLDNAIKYSRESGDHRLWLRARCGGRGRVVFEVEDRGPGVPPGERRSIFRPFRRGRGTAATTGGVGLGLALARRWTRLLGGRLALVCPAEGGACFRVEVRGSCQPPSGDSS